MSEYLQNLIINSDPVADLRHAFHLLANTDNSREKQEREFKRVAGMAHHSTMQGQDRREEWPGEYRPMPCPMQEDHLKIFLENGGSPEFAAALHAARQSGGQRTGLDENFLQAAGIFITYRP